MSNPIPQQKSGSSKTWIWILLALVGVIGLPIVSCVALCGGGLFFGVTAIMNNPVYKQSIEEIKSDAVAQERLGEGIEASMPNKFNIENTKAAVRFRVNGSKGGAEVKARGVGSTVNALTLTYDSGEVQNIKGDGTGFESLDDDDDEDDDEIIED